MPSAYPLAWPPGWARASIRQPARFGKRVWNRKYKSQQLQSLSVTVAVERLTVELENMGAMSTTLSTDLQLRQDGMPRSNQGEPGDPGVCLYFRMKGKDYCMPCDKWDRVADNIGAIAKHIEALRGQERWGVGDLSRAFAGYQALPAPDGGSPNDVPQWVLALGFMTDDLTLGVYEDRYKDLARKHHPDIGSEPDSDRMALLNDAIFEARRAKV